MKTVLIRRNGAAIAGIACLVVQLPPAGARATALTADGILNQFNLVTIDQATTHSDIEGSAVIGGTLSGSGTFFNSNVPTSPVVYLYGTNTGAFNIGAGGAVHYGSNTGSFTLSGGATAVQGGFPNPASAYTAPLASLSTELEGLAANSTAAANGTGTFTFKASPNANGLAVFSMTATALMTDLQNQNVTFADNGAKTIVVNVDGNFTEPTSANFAGAAQRNVIFNFWDATSVTLGNWETSVLLPDGTLGTTSGALEGSVFAKGFVAGGELHNYTFNGTLPAAAPEPAAAALLGAGLLALAGSRLRGRSALAGPNRLA